MNALTVWQPWAYLIAIELKPVENRTWAPPPSALGKSLAIHAGKKLRLEECAAAQEVFDEPGVRERLHALMPAGRVTWSDLPLGAVVAVVRLAGAVHESGRRVGGLTEERAREILADPFWVGPWGWVVDDVTQLAAPEPARGAQGIWQWTASPSPGASRSTEGT